MLRNSQQTTRLITNLCNHRPIHLQHGAINNKKSSSKVALQQGKIIGKLFGNKVTGSKRQWFPATESSNGQNVMFSKSQFGKPARGKNDTRRMTVLNKLFMKHITDMMATGEISEKLLGKGLQISRVKTTHDFAYINVFWMSTGDVNQDVLLENELQKSAGALRHELSQLGLMGEVPRIKFVKEKLFTNSNHVEALLKNMDFGRNESEENKEHSAAEQYASESLKQEFYGSNCQTTKPAEQMKSSVEQVPNLEKPMPEMRHDVLGLDHRGILLKILTKMRKSKQAWDQHQQNENLNMLSAGTDNDANAEHTKVTAQLPKNSNKIAEIAANSEKFKAFLAKRTERRNTPERKKYKAADHEIHGPAQQQNDAADAVLSLRQRQLLEAEDYLHEDEQLDNKKL